MRLSVKTEFDALLGSRLGAYQPKVFQKRLRESSIDSSYLIVIQPIAFEPFPKAAS